MHLTVHNARGMLTARIRGDNEAELRCQGVVITTGRGQKTCALWDAGRRLAICRRGVWTDAPAECIATWLGGRCIRAPRSSGLCAGHLAQLRRGLEYASLRAPHGADPRGLVSVTIQVPRADADTLTAGATTRGVAVTELYREAAAELAQRLRSG